MPDDSGTPDVYSDVFDFVFNPYGIAITFGRTSNRQTAGKPTAPDDQAIVRMSLQQAKVLSMLLRRSLNNFERENGLEIGLPYQVYTTLGVAREDWPPHGG